MQRLYFWAKEFKQHLMTLVTFKILFLMKLKEKSLQKAHIQNQPTKQTKHGAT